MSENVKIEKTETVAEDRRKFLKTAGQAALVAPAVMLILNASTKPADAQVGYCRDCITP